MNTVIDKYIRNLETADLLIDLIYFEGPMLSLSLDKEGNYFIYKWCGINEEQNENLWLIFSVSKELLLQYLIGEIPERYLIESADDNSYISDKYLLVSVSSKLKYTICETFSSAKTVPERFKPDVSIMFDKMYCEDVNSLNQLISDISSKIEDQIPVDFSKFLIKRFNSIQSPIKRTYVINQNQKRVSIYSSHNSTIIIRPSSYRSIKTTIKSNKGSEKYLTSKKSH